MSTTTTDHAAFAQKNSEIESIIERIYRSHPEALLSDRRLIWNVWINLRQIKDPNVVTFDEWMTEVTTVETITRAARKVRERMNRSNQLPPEVMQRRRELQSIYRTYYLKQE